MRDIRSWNGTLLLRAVCQVIVSPENSVLNHIYSDYSRHKVIKKCSRRVKKHPNVKIIIRFIELEAVNSK